MSIYDNYVKEPPQSNSSSQHHEDQEAREPLSATNQHHVIRSKPPPHPAPASMDDSRDGSGEVDSDHDGPPADLLPNGHTEPINSGTDAKKRPLSISSTSSSTSSTSSLPRQQRKKLASMKSTMARRVESGERAEEEHAMPNITVALSDSVVDTLTDDESEHTDNTSYQDEGDMNDSKSELDDEDSLSSSYLKDTMDLGLCEPSYIDKVVSEIVLTERTYVRALKEVIEVSF